MEILSMRNITKTFPGVIALDNVSFSCQRGEVHALVGENGAGKSTLIKILSGAYRPEKGEVLFRGEKLTLHSPLDAQRVGIATIYQEFNIVPYLNAVENIFLGREHAWKGFLNHNSMHNHAKQIMQGLGMDIDPNAPVYKLSVAQQQMVEIAKALSIDSCLIVMDEPTASLSELEIVNLFKTINKLQKRGVAVVYISHRLEEVFQIANRVTVLKDGKYVSTEMVKNISKQELIKMMVGRALSQIYPERNGSFGKNILELKNLTRKGVLNNISLTLKEGEVLGIGGLVGAGRTELARAIFGADYFDGGEVIIEGRKVTIKCPSDAIKQGMGFVPEDRRNQGLVQMLSVRYNITLTILKSLVDMIFINIKKENQVVYNFLEKLKIVTSNVEAKVLNLSGGNQQKVILAKWLAKRCKILIMDEPTRGIDVGAKVEIYHLIRELSDQGIGVLLITSELPELLGMSDRILVLHSGTIMGEFSREEATAEKVVACAMGGVH